MVWAFTNGMGVTLVNPKTNEKRWLFADQPDPVDRTSSSKFFITQDENHTLWVIPNQGTFSYYDRKPDNWYHTCYAVTHRATSESP